MSRTGEEEGRGLKHSGAWKEKLPCQSIGQGEPSRCTGVELVPSSMAFCPLLALSPGGGRENDLGGFGRFCRSREGVDYLKSRMIDPYRVRKQSLNLNGNQVGDE
jgi:hypothetical protein